MHVYSMWSYVHMHEGAHEAQRRDLDHLELKLLAVVNYLMKEKKSHMIVSLETVSYRHDIAVVHFNS